MSDFDNADDVTKVDFIQSRKGRHPTETVEQRSCDGRGDAQRSVWLAMSLGGIWIWIRTKTLRIRNTDSRWTVLVQNCGRYFGLISSLQYCLTNTGNANLTRIRNIRWNEILKMRKYLLKKSCFLDQLLFSRRSRNVHISQKLKDNIGIFKEKKIFSMQVILIQIRGGQADFCWNL